MILLQRQSKVLLVVLLVSFTIILIADLAESKYLLVKLKSKDDSENIFQQNNDVLDKRQTTSRSG
jgi:hypothetical protein